MGINFVADLNQKGNGVKWALNGAITATVEERGNKGNREIRDRPPKNNVTSNCE